MGYSDIEKNGIIIEPAFIHKDVLLLIIGKHPHSGEMCHPAGESKKTISTIGNKIHVWLIDCKHGDEYCFVPKNKLIRLHRNTDQDT